MSKNSTARFKTDITYYNIAVTVLAVLANAAIIFTLFNATRFSNLSGKTFILVNVVSIVLLILMNIAILTGIRTKLKPIYFSGVALAVAFLAIGAYGGYALVRVNRNVDKITSTVTTESVSTSLVVYSDTGTQTLKEVSQLNGRTVGYATGTHTATLGQERINGENMTVSFSEYQDYSSLILALFNGEIDCAILPTNYMAMFGNEAGMESFLANTASILDFEETVTIENTSGSDKDLTKDPFTVLLIGNADGLSDTMILCSVNPISMRVTMSSIARDSYVPITCYGGNSSKLNAAHAVSRDCLIATIEKLTGVEIDYYVDTNFKGVVEVVDALGGIVVDSPLEFVGQNSDSDRGAYTVWVPAGENVLLNGEQALAFARERHLFATGDFARQEHQQEVIEAILRKIMRTRDINTLLNVLDAAGSNIQTNISVSQMTGFLNYVLQKANRYYDQDHVEKIIQLQGSRVTGYSSGLWDEGLQMSLYIYRLWQGSLNDTRKAIERNIDMTSVIHHDSALQWSVNWDFYVPTISAEVYNEAIIPSDVPTTIGDYTGRAIGTLQSFCDANGIPLAITYVQDSSLADGTIVSQSVPAGTSIGSISSISATVVQNNGTEEKTPSSASEVKDAKACTALNWKWSDVTNKCYTTQSELEEAEEEYARQQATPDTSTKDGCEAKFGEGSWYNNRCYESKDAANAQKQADEAAAEAQRQAEAAAEAEKKRQEEAAKAAAEEEQRRADCESGGGTWQNGSCAYPEPTPEEETPEVTPEADPEATASSSPDAAIESVDSPGENSVTE
ncbi:MAG: LCP family protein [Solobacterium sp.]|nr:LCP family protein [Solobacterium sp.]